MSKTTPQPPRRRRAEIFGRLVERAKSTDPAVQAAEPGSDAELNAIHLFVLRLQPGLGKAFIAWVKARQSAQIPGMAPNGVTLEMQHALRIESRGDAFEVRANKSA